MSDRICYFCQHRTLYRKDTEAHLRKHTKEKPFECREENCCSTFAREWYLDCHNKTVHNIFKSKERRGRTFKCYFCSRDLPRLAALADHLLRHTGERPYKCPHTKCKNSSWDIDGRNAHAKLCSHNPDIKNYLQKRAAIQKKILKEGQFQCYFCLKNFRGKVTLYAHIKRHINEFTVTCSACKLQFNHREICKHRIICVKTHQLYVCPFCTSCRASGGELNRHIQTVHTKDRVKTKCYFCNASFLQAKMGNHLTTHTKEKAYKCGYCNVRYANNIDLKRHIASKHRDTKEGREVQKHLRRQCYFCLKYFPTYAPLRNHMVIHTKESRRGSVSKIPQK